MDRDSIIEADLTWMDDGFEPNVQVVVGADGLIEHVGSLDLQPTLPLKGRALLPGMVNAHSHAFQRGLRGFGEEISGGASFWSWRECLYELVELVDAQEFRNLARMAFEEMLHLGVTTVGEFHYFHHPRDSRDYGLDDLLLDAAAEVGIRLVLLCSYFARGDVKGSLSQVQERFASSSVDEFCAQVERLRRRVDGRLQRIGISAHSFRAATPNEIVELARYAGEQDMVFHIHVEAQRREIEACRATFGASPVELLLKNDVLNDTVTLIGCTHTPHDLLREVARAGARICVCPLTAANHGEGMADVAAMFEVGASVCLGTDSNVRISMNEEMRWLEYVQRVRYMKRGVCVDAQGRSANALWRCATVNGADALGVPAGRIQPGCVADFVAIDMRGLSLLGATPESLLVAFIYGAGRACITHTCVGGNWHVWHE